MNRLKTTEEHFMFDTFPWPAAREGPREGSLERVTELHVKTV